MEITTKSTANFTRLFDLIGYQLKKYSNASALNYYHGDQWVSISIGEFEKRVNALSCWFIENQYQKGDRVVLIPNIGSPEWMIVDFACQQAGIIVVPIHANLSEAEYDIILKETNPRLCLVTLENLEKITNAIQQLSQPAKVYHMEAGKPAYFEALNHHQINTETLTLLNQIKETINENDLTTIMYTSGSSGEPKGVMLSHTNIVYNIKSVLTFFPIEAGHRVLSFLPFSHILERTTTYAYLAFGASVYFSESRDSFARDFREVRPYFCTSVPRVLEKMYDFLQEQILSKHLIKRKTIEWAVNIGRKYKERERIGLAYGISLFFARLFVLYAWRKKLGGKIRYMAVGAAALRPEIGRLLSASGIHVVEGYGLTETAPLISINRFEPGMNRFGTVGLVIPGVQVKIDNTDDEDEGEILVKGPNVMIGYYLKPELTNAVFTEDGWFKTGDIGKWVHQHFLQITDRKKEIFKTSSGKYIAPLPLQNHFTKSPFIQRCLIIGFQRPFVTALLVPHFEILKAWCTKEGIHWTSGEFMIHNIKVMTLLKAEVEKLNEALQNFQRVRNFVLCAHEWSTENGEITATLKPVRTVLESRYKTEIEKMYKA